MVYKKIIDNHGLFPIKTQNITRIFERQYIFSSDKEDEKLKIFG
jgi:hypothetical protein